MRSYEIVSPIRRNGKRITSGTITLDEKEGGRLVALGALKASTAAPISPAAPPPPVEPKPLAEQSLEELQATAKAEKVPGWGPVKADQAKLLAAIERHRAKQAEA